jgi:nicotinate-nucleotide adenylyltransferase
VLAWLATQFDHVAVWTANNPFKTHQTPLSARFQMLELLISELEAPSGVVQLHPELSHMRSMVSIERARQEWPQADFYLVVGSDLVAQLPQWYRADDIFAATSILVVPRPGYPVDDEALAPLRQRAQVVVAAIPQPIDVSSSDYRHAEAEMALTPAVQAYVSQNQLYSCPENSRKKLTSP